MNWKMKAKLKAKTIEFFESPQGHGLLSVSALVLSYIFISWAIDSGSLLDWAITVILLIIALRELSALIRQLRGKKS